MSSGSSLENFPSLPSLQESISSINSTTARDKHTNEKDGIDGITDEVNLSTVQSKVQENSQEIQDDTERAATVVKVEQNVTPEENEVSIENAEQESTSDIPKENNYTQEEQKSNILENAKQNGPNYREHNSLQSPDDDNIEESSYDGKNYDIKESNVDGYIENHTNDVGEDVNCDGEENHGLKESNHRVIGTDNLTNKSKANSSIKCPS